MSPAKETAPKRRKTAKKRDRPLTVLHLCWEYPPRSVGGLAAHVHDLSRALVKKDIEVHVVTCGFPGAKDYEHYENVHVHRFDAYTIPSEDFLGWALQMNLYKRMKAADVIQNLDGEVDIIHAHDWLSGPAAIALKNAFRIPLVSTIHATEHGRRQGIHDSFQQMIHDVEGWLSYNSWRVIVCSKYMENEVSTVFGQPRDKLDIIPNGVDYKKFDLEFDAHAIKSQFAMPHERIVLYVGRMVHEKGLGVLVGSIPQVLESCPDAKFVLVGSGYMKSRVKQLAWDIGVGDKTLIPGYLDEEVLLGLYNIADVAVFPSLYEPFGIVALEGMAARTPTVVTDTGGLGEIVDHDETGVKVWVNNSESLAWGISHVLNDPALSKKLGEQGRHKVEKVYNWEVIADQTIDVYHRVLAEYKKGRWQPGFKPGVR